LKTISSPYGSETFERYKPEGYLELYKNSNGIKAEYKDINAFGEVGFERITSTLLGRSPLSYSAIYEYYKNGNLWTRNTSMGAGSTPVVNNYTYTYDSRYNLDTVTELDRGITDYNYDKNDNLTSITDPYNKTISFGYNQRDLVDSVTIGLAAEGMTYGFDYDLNGNMEKLTDPYNHMTQYDYDGYDRLRSVKDPLNNKTVIERSQAGNMLLIKRLDPSDVLIRKSVLVNDPLGRMTAYSIKDVDTDADVLSLSYTYADAGKLVTITDDLGRVSTVIKNDEGLVKKEIDAAGNAIEYYYDYEEEKGLSGNLTRKVETEKRQDGSGTEETHVTEYTYNAFNKIEKIRENAETDEPFITTFTYDEKGNLSGTIDAEENIITHKYDKFGRKEWTKKHFKNGQEITASFEYYSNNLLWKVKDDSKNETVYEYDGQKRPQKIIYPDTSYIEYTYGFTMIDNKKYRMETEKQRNGTIVETIYDGNNRVWKRSIDGAGAEVEGTTFETYAYDELSRLTEAVNDFSTVKRKYDSLNRITEEEQMGKVIKYTYEKMLDKKSLRQTIQYPNNRIIERDFDVLNRISKIREADHDLAAYEYIGRTYRLLTKQYNNGDVINYLYDQGRRLTSKEARNKNSDLISKYVYGYNKVNMKTFEKRVHDSGRGDVFSYDDIYRLTGVKFNSPEPDNPSTTQFEKSWSSQYDKVLNILKIVETQNGQTSEITTTMEGNNAKLNQYTTFDQWRLDYDLNGNMSQKGGQRFYYDYRNQLVRVVEGGATKAEYKYDALGRRISEQLTHSTTQPLTSFYYDGNQVIEERDDSDQIKRQLIYGNGIDELLIIVNYDGATAIPFYVHTNEIGSTTAITCHYESRWKCYRESFL